MQKTAYKVRISDWSSDFFSSDLASCSDARASRPPPSRISSLSFARSRASFDTRPARYRRIKILALCRDLDGKRPYRGRRSPYQLQRGHDEEKLRRPGCRPMLALERPDARHPMVDNGREAGR